MDQNYSMGSYDLNNIIDNATGHDITIELVGDNVIGANVDWVHYGIWSDNGLTITGEGTLTVYGGNACIFSNGTLTIDGADVTAYGKNDYGIASMRGDVVVKNDAEVTVKDCLLSLTTDPDYGGDIQILGGTLDLSSSGNAINTYHSLLIQNATVTARSNSVSTAVYANNLTIVDSGIEATSSGGNAIYAVNDLKIEGETTVVAQGGKSGLGARSQLLPHASRGKIGGSLERNRGSGGICR